MTKHKKVVLKLGGQCNLQCPNCHCMPLQFTYNPDIIPWMNEQQIEVVHLGGGEPFLYFSLMKQIVPQLKTVQEINVTTNGTLFTDDMADFCNHYGIQVSLSYDGRKSKRDPVLPNYAAVSRVERNGISCVYYHGNTDIDSLLQDIRALGKRHQLSCAQSVTIAPAFVHQTNYAPNTDTTRDDAKDYIQQMGRLMELGMLGFTPDSAFSLGTAYWFIRHFLNHEPYEAGCRCCNPRNVSLAIDGRFILCPYGDTFVGDIYTGVDWETVESHIPARCKTCPVRAVCGCSCVAQITDNECYIFRCLYRHYKKLLKKYHINENDLLQRFNFG